MIWNIRFVYSMPYLLVYFRYSGDFTDTGQMKTGQNNNGYVANAADYSSPSQSTLLLRNGSSNTSSDTTYYPNGQVPSVNSTLTRNSRSTTVDSRQDVGLPNVGSFNSLQNSILSEYTAVRMQFQISNEGKKFDSCYLCK